MNRLRAPGSGTAERGPHILDPHTGRPAGSGLASVTLTRPRLTETDAYATAAIAMGEAARGGGGSLPGYEALAVTGDGGTWHSVRRSALSVSLPTRNVTLT